MRYGFVAHLRIAVLFAVAAVSVAVLTPEASAATYSVKNTTELEEAVVKANANSGANTIVLAGGSYVPKKTLALTNTSGVQTIEGPTSAPTVRGQSALIAGSSVEPTFDQVLIVEAGVSAAIKNLEIGASGGLGTPGIEDIGGLTIESTTLEGNTGSGILVTTTGTLTARNSTISEDSEFGALVDGTASFVNSTIAFNTDGGIQNVGMLNLINTIVAENAGKGDCVGAATTSVHSLDSNGSCGVGALSKTNPLLQPSLLNNGGTTPVHSLKPGSPAIGAGEESDCPATDQRGAKRANPCSIGADEYNSTPPTINVPANITTPATSKSGAVVSYTATATATEELVSSFSCTPASGSTFPIGTTEVKCTAVTGHENTAKASFDVKVTTPKHTLTVTVSGEGTVTSTPAGIDCGRGNTECSAEFEEVAVTLTPTPAPSYTLSAWGGACSGTGSCAFSPLEANESVSAEFSAAPVPPAGGITTAGTAHVGETLSIAKGGKASEWTGASEGLTFQWEDCNATATECSAIAGATGNEYTLTALDVGYYVRVSVTAKNASGSTTARSSVSKVEMVHSFPVDVHGEVPFTQTLTSYCTEVNLGHFIPAETKTYTNTCNVTATDTDAASRLTAEDASATHTGHLVQGIYYLPEPLEVQATAEEKGSSTGVRTLAAPETLLNFAEPFADDLLTVRFTQKIGDKVGLHTGVYAKTITLTLSTTTP